MHGLFTEPFLTSLLFGLLRWRSGPDGFGFLLPAIPGPGWPLERVPPGATVRADAP